MSHIPDNLHRVSDCLRRKVWACQGLPRTCQYLVHATTIQLVDSSTYGSEIRKFNDSKDIKVVLAICAQDLCCPDCAYFLTPSRFSNRLLAGASACADSREALSPGLNITYIVVGICATARPNGGPRLAGPQLCANVRSGARPLSPHLA